MPVVADHIAVEGASLRLGLVNNMPDAALTRTERQFIAMLDAATPDIAIQLNFYSLDSLARGELGEAHLALRGYRSAADARADDLDAVIVTGTEPKLPDLRDEPYWPELAVLFDWIAGTGPSALFSCLAAHAAVLHYDGIVRAKLPSKRWGLFDHRVVGSHPLVAALPGTARVAHSRWNEISRGALEVKGYEVQTEAPDAGVDLFTKQTRNLQLFCQGHAEYDGGTLYREYRRDVLRFLAGERSFYPPLPQNYFTREEAKALIAFQARAVAERDASLIKELPGVARTEAVSPMASVYRAWLTGIAAARGPVLAEHDLPRLGAMQR
jgi:homoserine O-succinyltransferase